MRLAEGNGSGSVTVARRLWHPSLRAYHHHKLNLEIPISMGRYPSDDINKFLWMVRIGGGVFPEIKEKDYLGNGNYRVDADAGKVGPHLPLGPHKRLHALGNALKQGSFHRLCRATEQLKLVVTIQYTERIRRCIIP